MDGLMRQPAKRRRTCAGLARALVLGAALPLAACVLPAADIPPSSVVVPAAFEQGAGRGVPQAAGDLSQWWKVWRDAALDDLVRAALDSNTDIRIAETRVAEARSLVTIAESALYPTVAADGGLWRSKINVQSPPALSGRTIGFDGYWGGLGASWEPDIFGGRHADAEAARAAEAGAEERLNGARMTVAADVAENYFEARGLQMRLAVLDRGIATIEQLQRYVEARYVAGHALAYDVDLVREKLAAQRAKRPPLASLFDMRRRRLAVLAGAPPEAAPDLAPGHLFIVPPPPKGLPVEMLERRPDVRAQADLVAANAARLRSAKADLLPRFGVEFLGGDGRLHFDGLPGLSGTGGLVALTAYLPIFTAGRIQANIAASDARLVGAVADYDKAVLKALEDVENAYGLRNALDRRHKLLLAALAAARRNEQVAVGLYEGGRKTMQDVLDARINALNDEDERVQVEMGQATATVQLYRALGGGW